MVLTVRKDQQELTVQSDLKEYPEQTELMVQMVLTVQSDHKEYKDQ